jgi:hypothetical protein
MAGLWVLALLPMLSCSAFNPAALEVLLPPDVAQEVAGSAVDNPTGHVPVVFINNTRFSGALLDYLRSQNIEVDDPDLRPRVRFRVQVTFVGGAVSTFEFVDGSDIIEGSITTTDENGNPVIIPAVPPEDLLENDLNNAVVLCDVGAVTPDVAITSTSSSLEVFEPAFLKVIRVVETDFVVRRELVRREQPQFLPLLVDEVDENDSVTVVRNFGTREIPGFPTNLTCGSVVAFELSGDLTVPFVVDENNASVPGFLDTDTTSEATMPGRYALSVSVR